MCLIKCLFFSFCMLWAGEIKTNHVDVSNAPKWLTKAQVNLVTDRIQRFLEWDIRKVNVAWFHDEAGFRKALKQNAGQAISTSGSASTVLAFSQRKQNRIFIGPKVSHENFSGIFGHELGHIIMFQKYKDAIPQWLEEGLANFAAKNVKVDYQWLSEQPEINVLEMGHPFQESKVTVKHHYTASTALMEMISARCSIHDLLQLSVAEGLEKYLDTFCQIKDLNAEFKAWVLKKSKITKIKGPQAVSIK
jgi:hypothetical protein